MYYKLKVEEKLEGKPLTSYEMLVSLNDKLTRNEIKELIKDKEKEFKGSIKIKNAYGERRQDLMQIIPLSFLRKQGINPVPGLVLKIGEIEGIIKSVSGGRVIVDFNHPLAGKEIEFEIEVKEKFDDELNFAKELLNNLVKKGLLKEEDFKIEGNKIIIKENLKEGVEEILKKVYGLNVEVEALKDEESKDKKEAKEETKSKDKTKKENEESNKTNNKKKKQ